MTACILFNQTQRDVVSSDVPSGQLFDQYGPTKGYLDGNELNPIRRANDGSGNARFIVNAIVLIKDEFATAHDYMIGLPQIDSNDPNFPGPYVPPG
jgi:hypothetical protein